MWYLLPKRFFKFILFIFWNLTLIYLLFLSIITLILFNICLIIFIFWFILTIIGWFLAFIPILTFVFIPWYRRHCRLWTLQQKQSRLSVALFHSNCDLDRERILWSIVQSIVKKYRNDVQIIIYTGDKSMMSEDIFQHVKQHFDIDIKNSKSAITFIYLRSQFLLKNYQRCTLLRQSIGSMIVSFEALIRFIPDIYIDSSDYTFTYPYFYYLASSPIISYVQSPVINSNLIEPRNDEYVRDNSILTQIELLYYQLFTYINGWCGRCSKMVYCNSLWIKEQLKASQKSTSLQLLYPPCDIEQFLDIPLINKEQRIISIGQFQSETKHEFQIRAFYELLQKYVPFRIILHTYLNLFRKSKMYSNFKLILMGHVRHKEEQKCLEKLQILVEDLNIKDKVEFKININRIQFKSELTQAMIGLHTKPNQSFDIYLIEMMAAGVMIIGHESGGVQMDIIDDGQTGFLASEIESYVTKMQRIIEMSVDERCDIQKRARDSIDRFNRLNFERLFTELFDKIFDMK
ncbi:hypothetical protein I4U23_014614 [Adineta vaga]|nr:hypothetical protein I4U23_014614 [Adineta vaga]